MKSPQLTPVKSSNIDAVGFDDKRGLLVRFKGGGLYSYPTVPKRLHDELVAADSVGSFFARRVRGFYKHEQIDA